MAKPTHNYTLPPPITSTPFSTPPHFQRHPTSPAFIKLSRREVTKSSLLILLTSQFHHHLGLFNPRPAAAAAETEEENPLTTERIPVENNTEENAVETNSIVAEHNAVEANSTITEENAVEAKTNVAEDSAVEVNTAITEENTVEAKTNVAKDSAVEANTAVTEETNPMEENPVETKTTTGTTGGCTDKVVTKRAFLDISIDGQPVGRIVIGLHGNNVPAGATRLGDFISGAAGVSYRRKEFVKITPGYVQHGGVRSYGVDAELAAKTGRNLAIDGLIDEWETENGKCPGTKNVAGSVGIVVRDPLKPPPKQKLVARKGKLEIDEEEVGKDPNGTEFVISTKDSPELDASTLVVGEVLQGMEVVQRIRQVKTVQENTTSPYFRVAKLIGDKRAVVAERGFNRPYSKVVVTNCGLLT